MPSFLFSTSDQMARLEAAAQQRYLSLDEEAGAIFTECFSVLAAACDLLKIVQSAFEKEVSIRTGRGTVYGEWRGPLADQPHHSGSELSRRCSVAAELLKPKLPVILEACRYAKVSVPGVGEAACAHQLAIDIAHNVVVKLQDWTGQWESAQRPDAHRIYGDPAEVAAEIVKQMNECGETIQSAKRTVVETMKAEALAITANNAEST